MDHYQLIINEEQAKVLSAALESYSRLMVGQIRYALEPLTFQQMKNGKDIDHQKLRELCDKVKATLTDFSHPGASYGIHSREVDDSARMAYDIRKVIEHRLSYDRKPEGGQTVNFDIPNKTSQTQPLPVISVLINKEL